MFRRGKQKREPTAAKQGFEFVDPVVGWSITRSEAAEGIGLNGGGEVYGLAVRVAELMRPALLRSAVVEFVDRERSVGEETAEQFAAQLVSQEVVEVSEAAFWKTRFDSFGYRKDLQDADAEVRNQQTDAERQQAAIQTGLERIEGFVLGTYQAQLKTAEVGDPLLEQFDIWQQGQPREF